MHQYRVKFTFKVTRDKCFSLSCLSDPILCPLSHSILTCLLLLNNHAMRLLQQKGPKTSYSTSPLHSNTYALRIRPKTSYSTSPLHSNTYALRIRPKTSYSRSPLHSNTYALRIRLSCKTLINQTMLMQVLTFLLRVLKFYNICVRSIFILFSACL